MKVREAMLESPITVKPDELFADLLPRMLNSRQATAAVLAEDDTLLGVVGIHDILRKIVPLYIDLDNKLMEVMHEGYVEERLPRLKGTRIEELMVTEVDCVAPNDPLILAVSIIVEKRRKTLPVIEEGKFIGMITRRSILELVGPTLY